MDALSRLFAESAIRWRRDAFLRTRVALSAIYTAIAAFLLGTSSYLLYSALLAGLRESIDDSFIADPALQEALFVRAAGILQARILLLDMIVIVCVVVFAYALTAITLRPIRHARDRERRFLADAAHELRTPLAVMKTGIEIALRKKDPHPEARTLLESNLEEIDALSRMANDLLALARGASAGNPSISVLSPKALLEGVTGNLRVIAEDKRIALTTELEALEGIFVRGDEAAFVRALRNIIHNGIMYTNPGGTVRVDASFRHGRLFVSVADSGRGIAPEDLPHVTKAFYRADKSRAARHGAGLGLAIANETIVLYGGKLSIASQVGKGTTALVSLPAFRAPSPSGGSVANRNQENEAI